MIHYATVNQEPGVERSPMPLHPTPPPAQDTRELSVQSRAEPLMSGMTQSRASQRTHLPRSPTEAKQEEGRKEGSRRTLFPRLGKHVHSKAVVGSNKVQIPCYCTKVDCSGICDLLKYIVLWRHFTFSPLHLYTNICTFKFGKTCSLLLLF